MLLLCMPLAAEEVKDENIWNRFKDLTLQNADKLDFKQFVNIAWGFSKVENSDKFLWKAVE